ncbi:MAG: esterase-like activity of phytase family protein [Candidatus Binatia bacterium]
MVHHLAPLLLTVSLLLPVTADATARWMIVDPPQGAVALASGGTGAAELSGITWAGGTQFFVVGDNAGVVFPLTVTLDASSGSITTAALSAGIALGVGSDPEGLAYDSVNDSVYVGDESGPAIREHALADGSLLQTVAVPAVFSAYRPNLSLESLSRAPDGPLWTVNEEALSVDGPVSSSSTGTTVRLQRFDSALVPAGQWAYVTDPIAGDIGAPGRDIEVSGVSDLVALNDNQLLVLERALGVGLFRHRIYEVDFSTATDVSAEPDLTLASYTAVTKVLLWEGFSAINFEGIALGPMLDGGARSLLLVSDNGGGVNQSLLALTLLPAPACTAAPLPGCAPAGASALTVVSKDGTRDKLVWTWRQGALPDLSVFGDPTAAGGQGFAVCLYDSAAGVPQLRLSAAVPRGAPWTASGTTAFDYVDRSGSADGVMKVVLRAGTGTAKLKVKAKGAALGVPAPPISGTLLSRDPEITVQFVDRDAPGQCLGATFSAAKREGADRLKSKF